MLNDNMNDKRSLRIQESQSADRKSDKKQTANKIYTAVKELYNYQNENASRRWIWELIQNAKDLSYSDRKVDINIRLTDDDQKHLIFEHNGKNFNVDQITYLIKQVSSKEQNDPKVTGKFGTGFLSTHLLSKIITLKGILGFSSGGYTSFEIEMDRDANSVDEMIQKIDKSLADRDRIVNSTEEIDFDRTSFNTSFDYHLTEKSCRYAEEGIEDLELCLPYTLLFIDSINTVSVTHKNLSYARNGVEVFDNIAIQSILEHSNGTISTRYFAKIEQHDVSISVELLKDSHGDFAIKEVNEDLPRIFCDFPLLGSESFGLPFVINSPRFNPTEKRDGIYLKSDEEGEEIIENKQILVTGVELFGDLLRFVSENKFGSLYNIAKINDPKEMDWFDDKWVNDNIHSHIEELIFTTPLIRNRKGQLVSAKTVSGETNIFVPTARTPESREKLYHLLEKYTYAPFSPEKLPIFQDLEEWYRILSSDSHRKGLRQLSESLGKVSTLDELGGHLWEVDAIQWLDEYYSALKADEKLLLEVTQKTSALKIFVNQKDEFVTFGGLKRDDQIEEALKDAMAITGTDIRRSLISQKLIIKDWTEFDSLDNSYIIEKIDYFVRNGSDVFDLVLFITSLIPADKSEYSRQRELLFELLIFLWPKYNNPKLVKISNPSLWESSDRKAFNFISNAFKDHGSIERSAPTLNKTPDNICNYLTRFFDFIENSEVSNYINLQKIQIFPDQNGIFRLPSELKIDGGIDEKFIDILENLGWPIKNELLHNFVHVPANFMDHLDYQGIGNQISERIPAILKVNERSKEDQEFCIHLYSWLVDNREIAENHFKEIFSKKERLLSDEIIKQSIERSETLKQLEEMLGEEITPETLKNPVFIKSFVDALKKVSGGSIDLPEITGTKLIFATQVDEREYGLEDIHELMLSFGVTDDESYERLRAKFRFSRSLDLFDPRERFHWVQTLLNRAVDNVILKLSSLPDYDLSGLNRDSITTLTGIKFKGSAISIVVRPNDYRKVIIYYERELELLKETNTQFWVDNGDEQKQITIGHILEAMRLGVILNLG